MAHTLRLSFASLLLTLSVAACAGSDPATQRASVDGVDPSLTTEAPTQHCLPGYVYDCIEYGPQNVQVCTCNKIIVLPPVDAGPVDAGPPFTPSQAMTCVNTDTASVSLSLVQGVTTTMTLSCFPYECNLFGGVCLVSCSTSSQCASGAACMKGQCVVNSTQCTTIPGVGASGQWVGTVDPVGDVTQCPGNLTCDVARGTCLTNCVQSSDCLSGHVCSGGACTP